MKTKMTTLVCLLFAVGALSAAVRTVNLPSFGATNHPTVTAALNAASSGDIIYVAAGVYSELELTIPAGVTVIGGLPSGATSAAQRVYPGKAGIAPAEWTILDGSAAHRVAIVNGTIDGCIIRNGKHDTQGGGVLVNNTGTVQNCFIRGNQCHNVTNTAQGGGAYMVGNAKLINCVVDFNMASQGFGLAGAGTSTNATITNNTNAPVWISIPAGTFTRFSPSVTLSAYHIAQTETTNAQYAVFANAKGLTATPTMTFTGQTDSPNYLADGVYALFSANPWSLTFDSSTGLWVSNVDYEDKPMLVVTWYGSLAYSQWLGGKLPTEVQWEYAASLKADGGYYDNYSGSDVCAEVAWFVDNSLNTTQKVATKAGTSLGLFDMSGNLWEWCSDWYGADYPSSSTDPVGSTSGTYRWIRGGSSYDPASSCSVSIRSNITEPAGMAHYIGFRPIVQ